MDLLKKRSFKSGIKKIFSLVMMVALVMNILGLKQFTEDVKASGYVTITFVDNTPEKWVGTDSAVMELVDNTSGHTSYMMTKSGTYSWSVTIPESAQNITFNRYNPSKTIKWNSFSAGVRGIYNTYYATAHDTGYWGGNSTGSYFKAGDVIYLDTSSFTSWGNYAPTFYVNFTSATKSQNNGNDIYIPTANKNDYQPKAGVQWAGSNLYKYVVTSEDEGKTVLRFWRGNYNTLWNCSVQLTYSNYSAGYNCVKVLGWDNSGYVYKR